MCRLHEPALTIVQVSASPARLSASPLRPVASRPVMRAMLGYVAQVVLAVELTRLKSPAKKTAHGLSRFHDPSSQSRRDVSSYATGGQDGRPVLAVGPAAADRGLPADLPAAGDDLFRLWRAWTHRRQPRYVDQGAVDLEPGGNRGVAQPAADRQGGGRRTGALRSHLRLATKGLRSHRRRRHGLRHVDAPPAPPADGSRSRSRISSIFSAPC